MSGSSDGRIRFRILKLHDEKLTEEPNQPEPISLNPEEVAWSIAISSDGRLVAVGSNQGRVRIIDSTTRETKRTICLDGSLVKGLEFSVDNQHLITAAWASGGETSEISVWDVASGEHVSSITRIPFAISGFSKQGDWIAAGSKTGSIQIWSHKTGEPLSPVVNAHDNFVRDVEFSPDGTLLASASDDRTVTIWKCSPAGSGVTLTQAKTLTEHTGPVNSVKFSHDGTRLVSGSNDGTARVWLLDELIPLPARHSTQGNRGSLGSRTGVRSTSND